MAQGMVTFGGADPNVMTAVFAKSAEQAAKERAQITAAGNLDLAKVQETGATERAKLGAESALDLVGAEGDVEKAVAEIQAKNLLNQIYAQNEGQLRQVKMKEESAQRQTKMNLTSAELIAQMNADLQRGLAGTAQETEFGVTERQETGATGRIGMQEAGATERSHIDAEAALKRLLAQAKSGEKITSMQEMGATGRTGMQEAGAIERSIIDSEAALRRVLAQVKSGEKIAGMQEMGATGRTGMTLSSQERVARDELSADLQRLGMERESAERIANLQSQTTLRATGMQEAGATDRAGMQEAGATNRARMQETGATGRARMQEAGATGRTQMQESGANWRNELNTSTQRQIAALNSATSKDLTAMELVSKDKDRRLQETLNSSNQIQQEKMARLANEFQTVINTENYERFNKKAEKLWKQEKWKVREKGKFEALELKIKWAAAAGVQTNEESKIKIFQSMVDDEKKAKERRKAIDLLSGNIDNVIKNDPLMASKLKSAGLGASYAVEDFQGGQGELDSVLSSYTQGRISSFDDFGNRNVVNRLEPQDIIVARQILKSATKTLEADLAGMTMEEYEMEIAKDREKYDEWGDIDSKLLEHHPWGFWDGIGGWTEGLGLTAGQRKKTRERQDSRDIISQFRVQEDTIKAVQKLSQNMALIDYSGNPKLDALVQQANTATTGGSDVLNSRALEIAKTSGSKDISASIMTYLNAILQDGNENLDPDGVFNSILPFINGDF